MFYLFSSLFTIRRIELRTAPYKNVNIIIIIVIIIIIIIVIIIIQTGFILQCEKLPVVSKIQGSRSFHVAVLQKTATKCVLIMIYNARTFPLLCVLNLLFGDVVVAEVAY